MMHSPTLFSQRYKNIYFDLLVPCAEKLASDIGFVLSSYLSHFILVICYLLYFSNLHPPTVYVG